MRQPLPATLGMSLLQLDVMMQQSHLPELYCHQQPQLKRMTAELWYICLQKISMSVDTRNWRRCGKRGNIFQPLPLKNTYTWKRYFNGLLKTTKMQNERHKNFDALRCILQIVKMIHCFYSIILACISRPIFKGWAKHFSNFCPKTG